MKKFSVGVVALLVGGMLIYGGLSYISYSRTQEKVYSSWQNRNYVQAHQIMKDFENSFLFRGISFLPKLRDEFLYRKAWLAVALGNKEEALKQFSGLSSSDIVGDEANFAYGTLSLNPQDLMTSIESYKKALSQNPNNFKARVNLELLLGEKKRQEAMGDGDGKESDKKGDKEGDKKKKGGRSRMKDQFRFKDMPDDGSSSAEEPGLKY